MTYDPCAHVNGLAKPTYVHHRVLGRLRPRGKGPVSHPVKYVKPADPGIDAGCKRNVVLSRKTTFPAMGYKVASVLTIGSLAGGPTPPPVVVTGPPPTSPVVTPPISPVAPPGHPTNVPEPASLFLLLAGLVVLATARRYFGSARAVGLPGMAS